jgi:hypothetical protein
MIMFVWIKKGKYTQILFLSVINKGHRNEGVKGSLIQNMKDFYLYIKFDITIIKNGSFCISLEMIDLWIKKYHWLITMKKRK